jgi:hypothetical protein
MSAEEKTVMLLGYLKSLNEEQLDQALNEVLTEMRKREADQMKKDILTHSQSLRLPKITKSDLP